MNHDSKKVTIYDVAQKANVTIATVSRVINGKDNVALPTREKVIKAIEELNYYPSPIASGLSKNKSQEIGLLVPFFFGEFFLNLLSGVTGKLKEHDLILYNASSPEQKRELFAKIAGENKLDGLFVVSLPMLMEDEITMKNVKFPIILLDNKHQQYGSVSFDNVFGSYTAVEYLINLGHKRIGFITGAAEDPFHLTVAKDRIKGFKMAMAMAELPVDEKLVHINDWSRNGAKVIAKKMLSMKNPPSAIFAISDLQAVGVMEAAREMGLSIPKDLSVIGYDNMEFSDYLNLTTVSQPLDVCAQIGAEMLLRQINDETAKIQNIILQPALVERETCAPLS
jgi:DNA-binding LacI/PurR family transcriptional regulator